MSSTDGSSRSQTANLVIGFVTIFAMTAIIAWGCVRLYRWFSPAEPPGKIALSAYFETVEGASRLRIEGHVQQKGVPVRDGQVHLTVNRLNGDLRQSFMMPLDAAGRFLVTNSPALADLRPADRFYIEAEASAAGNLIASEVMYLRARKPLVARDKLLVGGGVIAFALLFAFLMAFTGNETPNRNRLAISFSYVVIILFFVLPLAAPVVLSQAYPDLQKIMEETPVGLVHAVVRDKDNANPVPQWYLNIGGVVRANDTNPEAPAELLGGLAIPFFILVLATMGGVINMTRRVPDSQNDAQSSVLDLFGGVPGMRRLFRGGRAASASESSEEEEDSAEESSRGKKRASVERPAWRTDLVKQYMYLVSAPFLGIVTYYLLIWLDLKQTPIVVLVSFSVGLISDSIVEKIISVVGGLLRKTETEKRLEKEAVSARKAAAASAASASGAQQGGASV
jgi:hypothetical protein